MDMEQLLTKKQFPRSGRYETDWMLDNQMGPNAVWLTEWLCEALPLEPGMRVLDLDQGRYIGFVRGMARRTRAESVNLYDPGIGARVGVDQ